MGTELVHSTTKFGHKLIHMLLHDFSFHAVANVEAVCNSQSTGGAWVSESPLEKSHSLSDEQEINLNH